MITILAQEDTLQTRILGYVWTTMAVSFRARVRRRLAGRAVESGKCTGRSRNRTPNDIQALSPQQGVPGLLTDGGTASMPQHRPQRGGSMRDMSEPTTRPRFRPERLQRTERTMSGSGYRPRHGNGSIALAGIAAVLAGLLHASPARALEFGAGELQGSLDTTLSHGVTFRVGERNPELASTTATSTTTAASSATLRSSRPTSTSAPATSVRSSGPPGSSTSRTRTGRGRTPP